MLTNCIRIILVLLPLIFLSCAKVEYKSKYKYDIEILDEEKDNFIIESYDIEKNYKFLFNNEFMEKEVILADKKLKLKDLDETVQTFAWLKEANTIKKTIKSKLKSNDIQFLLKYKRMYDLLDSCYSSYINKIHKYDLHICDREVLRDTNEK